MDGPTDHPAVPLPAGSIDLPTPRQALGSEPIRVAGWALLRERAGLARVDVTVDGRAVARARTGLPRPDLAAVAPYPDAPLCGFEHWLDPVGLADELRDAQVFTIGATARGFDGATFELPPVQISRDVEPGAEPRFLRIQDPGEPPARRTGTRLLAFTHSLERNGATLYLGEVLAGLAALAGLESTVVAPAEGALGSSLRDRGIRVVVAGPYPFDDPERYERRVLELCNLAEAEDAGFVMAHGSPTAIGVEVARRLGVPSSYWIGGSFTPREFFPAYLGWFPHPAVWSSIERAFAVADRVIFLAATVRDRYVREGIVPAGRAMALAPPADLAGFVPRTPRERIRSDLGIPPGARLILSVGVMAPLKGQGMLIQAFRHAASGPDPHLVLVGDLGDAYGAGIREYARRAGIEARCRILEPVDDVASLLGAADLFAFASDSEGGPRVVLEALTAGLPVVTTAVGDVGARIEDGRTGFVVPIRDGAAMADALRRALALPADDLRRIGAAGREAAASIGSLQAVLPVYAEMVRGLMGERDARRDRTGP